MLKLTTIVLLLAAGSAFAADHTVTLTAGQESRAVAGLAIENALTCARLALAPGCSDAQAKAKDPDAVIYASVTAMVRDFAIREFLRRRDGWDVQQRALFDAAREAASTAQRNSACAAIGLAAGCLP